MSKKWVYLFDEVEQAEKYVGGEWENVRGLLGGKGANLLEMVRHAQDDSQYRVRGTLAVPARAVPIIPRQYLLQIPVDKFYDLGVFVEDPGDSLISLEVLVRDFQI